MFPMITEVIAGDKRTDGGIRIVIGPAMTTRLNKEIYTNELTRFHREN